MVSLALETKFGALKFNITLEATKYMLSIAFMVARLPVTFGSNGSGCAAGSGLLVLLMVTPCKVLVNTGEISSRPWKAAKGPVTVTMAPAGGRLVLAAAPDQKTTIPAELSCM